jgi:hypothetical protein
MKSTEYNIESKEMEVMNKNWFISEAKSKDITFQADQVKSQNLLLKELIAQLRHENQMLKKRLFGAGKPEIVKDRCA